jgi:hypothetical protein
MTVRHEDQLEASFARERAHTGGPDFIVTPRRVTGGGR